ncbi:MAG TPA: HDIG domain-containing protein [Clostridiales bacterium]|nr:HDIG domain-containing protein [Clostridiales bacterium]
MTEKQQLFNEIDTHLQSDAAPSAYLNSISETHLFKQKPFVYLYRLKSTEQPKKYHPEGSVWNHTMLVVDRAAEYKTKSKDIRAFMWAALLHDIGKPDTRIRNGKITSYDHEKVGAALAKEFLSEFVRDEALVSKVSSLIRWHMQVLHVSKGLPFAEIKPMLAQTDVEEIALLGLCDRLGRLNADVERETESIKAFKEICLKEQRNA